MKASKVILDDDYIGGLGSLTVDEEKALSDYFQQKKIHSKRLSVISYHKTVRRSKVKN
jgi:hypothetical protein